MVEFNPRAFEFLLTHRPITFTNYAIDYFNTSKFLFCIYTMNSE